MNEIGSYRSGVVAIIGRANAGKSTLINRLLGEKIAIVTSKPQTTRSRILGVLTREEVQFLFVDTPGFHEGQKALNRALVQLAEEAIKDCDVALLLVDSTKGFSASYRDIVFKLQENTKPVVAVATKIDLVPKTEMHWPEELSFSARCSVSAKTNFGIDALLQLLHPLFQRHRSSPSPWACRQYTKNPRRIQAAGARRQRLLRRPCCRRR